MISGIGQGYILTTPIQLVTMTARIANGGYEVTPTFSKRSPDDKGAAPKMRLNQSNIALVKEGMFDVVNIPGGTAYRSRFDFNGQKMAGKTGTTQVRRISMKERQTGIIRQEDLPWKYRNHALFVGYAPHDAPRYAVVVLVEHGRSGSGVAAPIGGKLLLEALMLEAQDKKDDEK